MSASTTAHHRPVVRAALEALEGRRYFAAAIENRVLHVVGTNLADSIILFRDNSSDVDISVTINGVESIFLVADFDSTFLEAGMGNDVVDAQNLSGLPVTLVGNAGNDRLASCSSGDLIYGNDGLDTISGNDGNDTIFGGNGSDRVIGGVGNDRASGEAGNDFLQGGDGDDAMDGNEGVDNLDGEGGRDVLTGGSGNDNINGGVGNDRMADQDGFDTYAGGDGNDSMVDEGAGGGIMVGGRGNDT
ncbi:MAG: hypothetical protein M3478_06265, partial [Planctomycetota bacterium]|nr:hypothetical protein [Planctomycetota bacterium]